MLQRDQRNQGASLPSGTPGVVQESVTALIIKSPTSRKVDQNLSQMSCIGPRAHAELYSKHMGNRMSEKRSARPPKSFRKKKRRSGFGGAEKNGNHEQTMVQPMGGVCQKCGHPAPDGKLCQFHRNLLNSLRDGYR